MAAQYAILRFKKYKGPEIGNIEAHNERRKEAYASNPDIDPSRSSLNFHLITPSGKYRAQAEQQIKAAGCRTRSDSVRIVETLITASPEFFEGKSPKEIRAFFMHALDFMEKKQAKETIISAVVHMDEKTPHMHLSFVPLTQDRRLSAKEILGNKKNLTKWQDEYWKHMVSFYPALERGESASETGRTHIPPRIFKQAFRLSRQKEKLMTLLGEITPLNVGKKSAEIEKLLQTYIPDAEKMRTALKKYEGAFKAMKAENAALEKKVDDLTPSIHQQLEAAQPMQEFEELRQVVAALPDEVLANYRNMKKAAEKDKVNEKHAK